MKMLNRLKNNKFLKTSFICLIFFLLLKGLFILCDIFIEYIWVIDLLSWWLFSILWVLTLLKILLSLPLTKDLQEEMAIFNEGSVNKSSFMAYLRKHHYLLLLSTYLLYPLAVTYSVENPLISYLFGLIAFINLILYLIQFTVYTNAYIAKSFKYNKSTFNQDKRKGSTRSMFTSAFNYIGIKKVVTICFECAKGVATLGGVLEIGYKLTHGGFNVVPFWRQEWLNNVFPEDDTKVWTESKAAAAMHNRAMGNPHNFIYGPIDEKIKKVLPKEK